MALAMTPTQEHYRSWSFEKTANSHFASPASETSSGIFFDAEERIRISATRDDVEAALKVMSQRGFDEEYQSSEEALSPMLEEETGQSVDDNEVSESDESEYLWSELESLKVDIAVAICVTAAGKAQVVNVPHRWAAFRNSLGYRSHRSLSQTSAVSAVSSARVAPPRLDIQSATHFATDFLSDASSRSMTPDSVYSNTHVPLSSHRTVSSTASAASWTPSTSAQSMHSTTASFLNSDPFDNAQPRNSTRLRLRHISSKIMSSTSSPSTESKQDDSGKESKRKHRRSLRLGARPERSESPVNAPFFFSQRARDEWYREHAAAAPLSRSSTPPVSSSTPTQKSFPKPRMMARGANEREPMMELPPCPNDYDMGPSTLSRGSYSAAPKFRKASLADLKRQSMMSGRV